ncbi:MAG TPA: FliH/SctL family protein, partial [Thermoanaerobaculia bacterium]|nr:FliH/SctL family protein [Thermoanaerobaculia bacterium]
AEGLAAWQSELAHIAAERVRLIEAARKEILELALAVAQKILHQQLTVAPEIINPLVEEVLRSVKNAARGKVLVTVHPDDRPVVERCLAHLKSRALRWEVMELASDPTMARGGCRVESEHGEIDATVETQIAAIRRILLREGTSHASP